MREIPAGVILIWAGTHAGIPTGWQRETTLDSLYPKAWGSESPNATGGSNTHTHSSSSHSHTANTHSHDVTVNSSSESSTLCDPDGHGNSAHNHQTSVIGSPSGLSINSQAITWGSVNHEPPYYSVIFIKPVSTWADLQTGIIGHFNGATVPSGWGYCDGSGGAPDFTNKYLKGAGTGADAGGTGGATTHGHSITHNHTATGHTHSGTSNTYNLTPCKADGAPSGDVPCNFHTHTINLDSTTISVDNYTNASAGNTDTVEPAYKKVGTIRRSTGDITKGLIGLWLGGVSSIPFGWVLCNGENGTVDMQNKFIKIGTSLAQNGNTGGANTHQHSSVSHTHTSPTHNHTGSTGYESLTTNRGGNQTTNMTFYPHTHTMNTVSNVAVTMSSDSLDCGASANQPSYRGVAYIEYQKPTTPMNQII